MRIFIHEYLCVELAGDNSVPASLRAEGQAMLAAVLRDFGSIPGVEVLTLGSPPPARPDLPQRFRELARQADWTLVIAPEFDDILYTRCQWVEEAGGRLLGPSAEAVRLTADKLLLSVYLRERGVLTPPCCTFLPGEPVRPEQFPLVLKPRFGAGSQATYLLPSSQQLTALAGGRAGLDGAREMVLQPFARGLAASVAFLIGPTELVPLRPASPEFSTERVFGLVERFCYEGGRVPLPEPYATRAERVARRAVEVVPGLRGYVGVDVVLGFAEDGSADQVLEINPRLTTSYVGLRELAVTNLAEAMLRMAAGAKGVEVRWRRAAVRFRADGTIDSRD